MGSLFVEAETTADGAGARLDVVADVDCSITPGDPPTIPAACATLAVFTDLTDLIDSIVASSGVQRVGWRVRVAGVRVPDEDLLDEDLEVSSSIDRSIQVGRFDTVALGGSSFLGAFGAGAALPGLKAIDFAFAYATPTGTEFEEKLLTGGIAIQSERSISVSSILDETQVGDRNALFADVPVDFRLRPGSRMLRNEVVRRILVAAGIPASELAISGMRGRMSKAVDATGADAFALAGAICEVEGGRLMREPGGQLVVAYERPEREQGPIRWHFKPSDIVAAVNGSRESIEVTPAPDAWTEVSLRGTKQVESDQQSCGSVTVPLESSNVSVFAPVKMPRQQAAGGSKVMTDTGGSDPVVAKRIRSRTVTLVTKECEEVVATRTELFRYFLRKQARYQRTGTNAAAPINNHFLCYVDDDDTGHGRASVVERLARWSVVTESREFDDEGLLVLEQREVQSWYNPRRAQKERTDQGDAWDLQDANTANVWDLGDGQYVTFAVDQFILVERRTVKYTNVDGYMRSREQSTRTYARVPGFTHLYHDGEFGQVQETFLETERITETWEALSESVVRYTRLVEGIGGELVDFEPGSTSLGQPPAAVRRSDAAPKVEGDLSEDDLEDAVAASRFESQEIRASCSAPGLETVRPRKVLRDGFWEWAESERELQDLCTRLILFGYGFGVAWTILANGRVKAGDWCFLQGPPGSGVAHAVLISDVGNSGSQQGAKLTRLRGVAYPPLSILPYAGNPD